MKGGEKEERMGEEREEGKGRGESVEEREK